MDKTELDRIANALSSIAISLRVIAAFEIDKCTGSKADVSLWANAGLAKDFMDAFMDDAQ